MLYVKVITGFQSTLFLSTELQLCSYDYNYVKAYEAISFIAEICIGIKEMEFL
jgi:hypothetical protein